jgi:transcriptional regulator with XRE-family HTH domain
MGRASQALKQTLQAHQISQNRLASALRSDRSVVNRWFHGQVDPNGETIVAIVKALKGISLDAAEQFIRLYLGDLMRDEGAIYISSYPRSSMFKSEFKREPPFTSGSRFAGD